MIRARIVNGYILNVSGLDPSIPRREVQEWMGDVAEQVDERIAADWDRERAAGFKMPANDPATTERKAAEGLDTKVGTATGNLQDHLDSGGYWKVGPVSRGRVTVTWDEAKLQRDVGYAEYVAELKVRGGRILAVLQKDARMAERYLEDRERDWARAQERKTARSGGRTVAPAARRRSGLGSRVRVA